MNYHDYHHIAALIARSRLRIDEARLATDHEAITFLRWSTADLLEALGCLIDSLRKENPPGA